MSAESFVQQENTATGTAGTDLIRPLSSFDLRERPVETALQLVHTEVIIRLNPEEAHVIRAFAALADYRLLMTIV
jgi:hypothetical protein